MYYGFSEVIDPKDFADQAAYVDHVSNRFKSFFLEMYQAVQKRALESPSSKKIE